MTEAEFDRYIQERFPTAGKRSTSGIIRRSFGAKIAEVLRNPAAGDKNLRFYIKKHGFQLLDLPSLGMKDVLVVTAREQVGGAHSSKRSPPAACVFLADRP